MNLIQACYLSPIQYIQRIDQCRKQDKKVADLCKNILISFGTMSFLLTVGGVLSHRNHKIIALPFCFLAAPFIQHTNSLIRLLLYRMNQSNKAHTKMDLLEPIRPLFSHEPSHELFAPLLDRIEEDQDYGDTFIARFGSLVSTDKMDETFNYKRAREFILLIRSFLVPHHEIPSCEVSDEELPRFINQLERCLPVDLQAWSFLKDRPRWASCLEQIEALQSRFQVPVPTSESIPGFFSNDFKVEDADYTTLAEWMPLLLELNDKGVKNDRLTHLIASFKARSLPLSHFKQGDILFFDDDAIQSHVYRDSCTRRYAYRYSLGQLLTYGSVGICLGDYANCDQKMIKLTTDAFKVEKVLFKPSSLKYVRGFRLNFEKMLVSASLADNKLGELKVFFFDRLKMIAEKGITDKITLLQPDLDWDNLHLPAIVTQVRTLVEHWQLNPHDPAHLNFQYHKKLLCSGYVLLCICEAIRELNEELTRQAISFKIPLPISLYERLSSHTPDRLYSCLNQLGWLEKVE